MHSEGSTVQRIVYVGPHDSVDVPTHRLRAVPYGTAVEVSAAAAERLLEQADNWAEEGSEAAAAASQVLEDRAKRSAAAVRAERRAARNRVQTDEPLVGADPLVSEPAAPGSTSDGTEG